MVPISRVVGVATLGLLVVLSTPMRVVVGARLIARPGDFNGDGSADLAVYRPASSTWKIRGVGDVQFGQLGDILVPADYNGDGIQDVAVWRLSRNGDGSSGTFFVDGQVVSTLASSAGDIPVPADYNGDGKAEVGIYNPGLLIPGIAKGRYCVQDPFRCVSFDSAGISAIPVPADYNGDGKAEAAIYCPSGGASPGAPGFGATGLWRVEGMADVQWGNLGDIPVPADYNGDGIAEVAVYRPAASGSVWYVKGVGTWTFGFPGDFPLPQDINGDGVADLVLYRPSTATWYVYFTGTGATQTIPFGALGDVPALLPAYYQLHYDALDADGDRRRDFTIFRPKGLWHDALGSTWDAWWWTRFSSGDNSSWATSTWQGIPWGTVGDIPVPGDYEGDRRMDSAIYRPSDGKWWVRFSSGDNSSWETSTWRVWQVGQPGDIPIPGDYDGDGRTDPGVYRPGRGILMFWPSSNAYADWHYLGPFPNFPADSSTQLFAADFNGDGRTDYARCLDGGTLWDVVYSKPEIPPWNQATVVGSWNSADFVNPVCLAADFDGDGRADPGVYAPATGQWAWMLSSTNYSMRGGGWYWGIPGDVPVPGDYDGDGRADLAIYRPADGWWWILLSSSNYTTYQNVQWGPLAGDLGIRRGDRSARRDD